MIDLIYLVYILAFIIALLALDKSLSLRYIKYLERRIFWLKNAVDFNVKKLEEERRRFQVKASQNRP